MTDPEPSTLADRWALEEELPVEAVDPADVDTVEPPADGGEGSGQS